MYVHLLSIDPQIKADWARALDLIELRFDRSKLMVLFRSESGPEKWAITFRNIQAFRVTTEECAAAILGMLTERGAFYEIVDSDWIAHQVSQGVSFIAKSRHFIICFYDEILEVIACEFTVERVPN